MTAAVHLVAGLNGAGKTTLAKDLAAKLPGVRFSLDEWMMHLHGLSFDDPRYPELAEQCRELIWDMAAQVLRAEVAVILDWNHWSRARRADTVRRAAALESSCELHYVKVPIETAVARAAGRNDPTSHHLTAEGIHHVDDIFEIPEESEGFSLHVIDNGSRD